MVEYKERTPDHPHNCLYVPTFSIEIYKTRQGTQGQNAKLEILMIP
ncbi:conserved protein of unknown function [Limnospira indica PCC 8005]|uniref:Uncharacterized protein n=1 Tax=Limnospira indica PCC 8005 TaxID=376219 RepID=A0A9P1NWJ3_9CYAN|nr:conserved protein of unknown function [Limnospira indica PCC 8005]